MLQHNRKESYWIGNNFEPSSTMGVVVEVGQGSRCSASLARRANHVKSRKDHVLDSTLVFTTGNYERAEERQFEQMDPNLHQGHFKRQLRCFGLITDNDGRGNRCHGPVNVLVGGIEFERLEQDR